VFAPTNEAFNKLPAGTVDTLLKPENKATLTKVLTYHVVAGHLSAHDLMKKIKAGKGTAELTTVEGGKLLGHAARWQAHRTEGRKGRYGDGHDCQRVSIERRDSRYRRRSDAQLREPVVRCQIIVP
jgi:hypothetical protein